MKEKELDDIIRKNLTQEEMSYYDQLEDPNMIDKVLRMYKGKNAWVFLVQTIAMLLVFIAFIYCTVQFFQEDDVAKMLKWGFGCFLTINAVGMIKVILSGFMSEINIIREIKRLELQLASIADSIKETKEL